MVLLLITDMEGCVPTTFQECIPRDTYVTRMLVDDPIVVRDVITPGTDTEPTTSRGFRNERSYKHKTNAIEQHTVRFWEIDTARSVSVKSSPFTILLCRTEDGDTTGETITRALDSI